MTEYSFVLFVTGNTPNSRQAIENLRRICEDHLRPDQFEISVVDVIEEPERADVDRVIATPCVIRAMPGPPLRVIGDMSATSQVAAALGVPFRQAGPSKPPGRNQGGVP